MRHAKTLVLINDDGNQLSFNCAADGTVSLISAQGNGSMGGYGNHHTAHRLDADQCHRLCEFLQEER